MFSMVRYVFVNRPLLEGLMVVDVRNIISDDDALQAGVKSALREYNLGQFITVDIPGTRHPVRCHH